MLPMHYDWFFLIITNSTYDLTAQELKRNPPNGIIFFTEQPFYLYVSEFQ